MSSEWFVWDPSSEREAHKMLLISSQGTLAVPLLQKTTYNTITWPELCEGFTNWTLSLRISHDFLCYVQGDKS